MLIWIVSKIPCCWVYSEDNGQVFGGIIIFGNTQVGDLSSERYVRDRFSISGTTKFEDVTQVKEMVVRSSCHLEYMPLSRVRVRLIPIYRSGIKIISNNVSTGIIPDLAVKGIHYLTVISYRLVRRQVEREVGDSPPLPPYQAKRFTSILPRIGIIENQLQQYRTRQQKKW